MLASLIKPILVKVLEDFVENGQELLDLNVSLYRGDIELDGLVFKTKSLNALNASGIPIEITRLSVGKVKVHFGLKSLTSQPVRVHCSQVVLDVLVKENENEKISPSIRLEVLKKNDVKSIWDEFVRLVQGKPAEMPTFGDDFAAGMAQRGLARVLNNIRVDVSDLVVNVSLPQGFGGFSLKCGTFEFFTTDEAWAQEKFDDDADRVVRKLMLLRGLMMMGPGSGGRPVPFVLPMNLDVQATFDNRGNKTPDVASMDFRVVAQTNFDVVVSNETLYALDRYVAVLSKDSRNKALVLSRMKRNAARRGEGQELALTASALVEDLAISPDASFDDLVLEYRAMCKARVADGKTLPPPKPRQLLLEEHLDLISIRACISWAFSENAAVVFETKILEKTFDPIVEDGDQIGREEDEDDVKLKRWETAKPYLPLIKATLFPSLDEFDVTYTEPGSLGLDIDIDEDENELVVSFSRHLPFHIRRGMIIRGVNGYSFHGLNVEGRLRVLEKAKRPTFIRFAKFDPMTAMRFRVLAPRFDLNLVLNDQSSTVSPISLRGLAMDLEMAISSAIIVEVSAQAANGPFFWGGQASGLQSVRREGNDYRLFNVGSVFLSPSERRDVSFNRSISNLGTDDDVWRRVCHDGGINLNPSDKSAMAVSNALIDVYFVSLRNGPSSSQTMDDVETTNEVVLRGFCGPLTITINDSLHAVLVWTQGLRFDEKLTITPLPRETADGGIVCVPAPPPIVSIDFEFKSLKAVVPLSTKFKGFLNDSSSPTWQSMGGLIRNFHIKSKDDNAINHFHGSVGEIALLGDDSTMLFATTLSRCDLVLQEMDSVSVSIVVDPISWSITESLLQSLQKAIVQFNEVSNMFSVSSSTSLDFDDQTAAGAALVPPFEATPPDPSTDPKLAQLCQLVVADVLGFDPSSNELLYLSPDEALAIYEQIVHDYPTLKKQVPVNVGLRTSTIHELLEAIHDPESLPAPPPARLFLFRVALLVRDTQVNVMDTLHLRVRDFIIGACTYPSISLRANIRDVRIDLGETTVLKRSSGVRNSVLAISYKIRPGGALDSLVSNVEDRAIPAVHLGFAVPDVPYDAQIRVTEFSHDDVEKLYLMSSSVRRHAYTETGLAVRGLRMEMNYPTLSVASRFNDRVSAIFSPPFDQDDAETKFSSMRSTPSLSINGTIAEVPVAVAKMSSIIMFSLAKVTVRFSDLTRTGEVDLNKIKRKRSVPVPDTLMLSSRTGGGGLSKFTSGRQLVDDDSETVRKPADVPVVSLILESGVEESGHHAIEVIVVQSALSNEVRFSMDNVALSMRVDLKASGATRTRTILNPWRFSASIRSTNHQRSKTVFRIRFYRALSFSLWAEEISTLLEVAQKFPVSAESADGTTRTGMQRHSAENSLPTPTPSPDAVSQSKALSSSVDEEDSKQRLLSKSSSGLSFMTAIVEVEDPGEDLVTEATNASTMVVPRDHHHDEEQLSPTAEWILAFNCDFPIELEVVKRSISHFASDAFLPVLSLKLTGLEILATTQSLMISDFSMRGQFSFEAEIFNLALAVWEPLVEKFSTEIRARRFSKNHLALFMYIVSRINVNLSEVSLRLLLKVVNDFHGKMQRSINRPMQASSKKQSAAQSTPQIALHASVAGKKMPDASLSSMTPETSKDSPKEEGEYVVANVTGVDMIVKDVFQVGCGTPGTIFIEIRDAWTLPNRTRWQQHPIIRAVLMPSKKLAFESTRYRRGDLWFERPLRFEFSYPGLSTDEFPSLEILAEEDDGSKVFTVLDLAPYIIVPNVGGASEWCKMVKDDDHRSPPCSEMLLRVSFKHAPANSSSLSRQKEQRVHEPVVVAPGNTSAISFEHVPPDRWIRDLNRSHFLSRRAAHNTMRLVILEFNLLGHVFRANLAVDETGTYMLRAPLSNVSGKTGIDVLIKSAMRPGGKRYLKIESPVVIRNKTNIEIEMLISREDPNGFERHDLKTGVKSLAPGEQPIHLRWRRVQSFAENESGGASQPGMTSLDSGGSKRGFQFVAHAPSLPSIRSEQQPVDDRQRPSRFFSSTRFMTHPPLRGGDVSKSTSSVFAPSVSVPPASTPSPVHEASQWICYEADAPVPGGVAISRVRTKTLFSEPNCVLRLYGLLYTSWKLLAEFESWDDEAKRTARLKDVISAAGELDTRAGGEDSYMSSIAYRYTGLNTRGKYERFRIEFQAKPAEDVAETIPETKPKAPTLPPSLRVEFEEKDHTEEKRDGPILPPKNSILEKRRGVEFKSANDNDDNDDEEDEGKVKPRLFSARSFMKKPLRRGSFSERSHPETLDEVSDFRRIPGSGSSVIEILTEPTLHCAVNLESSLFWKCDMCDEVNTSTTPRCDLCNSPNPSSRDVESMPSPPSKSSLRKAVTMAAAEHADVFGLVPKSSSPVQAREFQQAVKKVVWEEGGLRNNYWKQCQVKLTFKQLEVLVRPVSVIFPFDETTRIVTDGEDANTFCLINPKTSTSCSLTITNRDELHEWISRCKAAVANRQKAMRRRATLKNMGRLARISTKPLSVPRMLPIDRALTPPLVSKSVSVPLPSMTSAAMNNGARDGSNRDAALNSKSPEQSVILKPGDRYAVPLKYMFEDAGSVFIRPKTKENHAETSWACMVKDVKELADNAAPRTWLRCTSRDDKEEPYVMSATITPMSISYIDENANEESNAPGDALNQAAQQKKIPRGLDGPSNVRVPNRFKIDIVPWLVIQNALPYPLQLRFYDTNLNFRDFGKDSLMPGEERGFINLDEQYFVSFKLEGFRNCSWSETVLPYREEVLTFGATEKNDADDDVTTRRRRPYKRQIVQFKHNRPGKTDLTVMRLNLERGNDPTASLRCVLFATCWVYNRSDVAVSFKSSRSFVNRAEHMQSKGGAGSAGGDSNRVSFLLPPLDVSGSKMETALPALVHLRNDDLRIAGFEGWSEENWADFIDDECVAFETKKGDNRTSQAFGVVDIVKLKSSFKKNIFFSKPRVAIKLTGSTQVETADFVFSHSGTLRSVAIEVVRAELSPFNRSSMVIIRPRYVFVNLLRSLTLHIKEVSSGKSMLRSGFDVAKNSLPAGPDILSDAQVAIGTLGNTITTTAEPAFRPIVNTMVSVATGGVEKTTMTMHETSGTGIPFHFSSATLNTFEFNVEVTLQKKANGGEPPNLTTKWSGVIDAQVEAEHCALLRSETNASPMERDGARRVRVAIRNRSNGSVSVVFSEDAPLPLFKIDNRSDCLLEVVQSGIDVSELGPSLIVSKRSDAPIAWDVPNTTVAVSVRALRVMSEEELLAVKHTQGFMGGFQMHRPTSERKENLIVGNDVVSNEDDHLNAKQADGDASSQHELQRARFSRHTIMYESVGKAGAQGFNVASRLPIFSHAERHFLRDGVAYMPMSEWRTYQLQTVSEREPLVCDDKTLLLAEVVVNKTSLELKLTPSVREESESLITEGNPDDDNNGVIAIRIVKGENLNRSDQILGLNRPRTFHPFVVVSVAGDAKQTFAKRSDDVNNPTWSPDESPDLVFSVPAIPASLTVSVLNEARIEREILATARLKVPKSLFWFAAERENQKNPDDTSYHVPNLVGITSSLPSPQGSNISPRGSLPSPINQTKQATATSTPSENLDEERTAIEKAEGWISIGSDLWDSLNSCDKSWQNSGVNFARDSLWHAERLVRSEESRTKGTIGGSFRVGNFESNDFFETDETTRELFKKFKSETNRVVASGNSLNGLVTLAPMFSMESNEMGENAMDESATETTFSKSKDGVVNRMKRFLGVDSRDTTPKIRVLIRCLRLPQNPERRREFLNNADLDIHLDVSSLGLSINDVANKREVAYASLQRFKIRTSRTLQGTSMDATLGNLQLDNQMPDAAFQVIFAPVLLPPLQSVVKKPSTSDPSAEVTAANASVRTTKLTGSMGSMSSLHKKRSHFYGLIEYPAIPFAAMHVVIHDTHPSVRIVESFRIVVHRVNISVEELFLTRLLGLMVKSGLYNFSFSQSQSKRKIDVGALKIDDAELEIGQLSASGNKRMIQLDSFEIRPLHVNITVDLDGGRSLDDDAENITDVAMMIPSLTLEINDLPLRVAGLRRAGAFLSPTQFQDTLYRFYRYEIVVWNGGKILTNTNWGGNPIQAGKRVATGFFFLVEQPVKGLTSSDGNYAIGFLTGLRAGTSAFLIYALTGATEMVHGLSNLTVSAFSQLRGQIENDVTAWPMAGITETLRDVSGALAESSRTLSEEIVAAPKTKRDRLREPRKFGDGGLVIAFGPGNVPSSNQGVLERKSAKIILRAYHNFKHPKIKTRTDDLFTGITEGGFRERFNEMEGKNNVVEALPQSASAKWCAACVCWLGKPFRCCVDFAHEVREVRDVDRRENLF